jgi:hypothetical protein
VTRLAAGDPALHRMADARPYDCRGSFVSLHLRAGASPLEVAQWAGHSSAVTFKHYANVTEELVGEPPLAAHEQITRAREAVERMPKHQLDTLVVDLMEQPSVAESGEQGAAAVFYGPNT